MRSAAQRRGGQANHIGYLCELAQPHLGVRRGPLLRAAFEGHTSGLLSPAHYRTAAVQQIYQLDARRYSVRIGFSGTTL
jgi:hypothetical protein